MAIVPDGALLTRPDALMSAAQEAAAQSLTGKDPTVFIAQLDAGQRVSDQHAIGSIISQ